VPVDEAVTASSFPGRGDFAGDVSFPCRVKCFFSVNADEAPSFDFTDWHGRESVTGEIRRLSGSRCCVFMGLFAAGYSVTAV